MTDETRKDVGPDRPDAKTATAQKRKKKLVVGGVVAAVVVAAGAGFMVWHEQPSFCNAICHTPMDAYLETYEGSIDKYGNELDETARTSMLSYVHGSALEDGESVNCLGCHVPQMSEQVAEGINWVSGNYVVAGDNALGQTILEERELSDLVEARGIEDDAFCLNESCHHVAEDGSSIQTRDDLVAATAALDETYNPHLSQHSELACSDCHKAHAQSVNLCTQCHTTAPVPDGWLSVYDAKDLHDIGE